MSTFPKASLRKDALVFGCNAFHGGRLNKQGDGIVEIEIWPDLAGKEVTISLFDTMSLEDGHYAPVSLTLDQAELLHKWLGHHIGAMRKEGGT